MPKPGPITPNSTQLPEEVTHAEDPYNDVLKASTGGPGPEPGPNVKSEISESLMQTTVESLGARGGD